jgi:hypothetical protein
MITPFVMPISPIKGKSPWCMSSEIHASAVQLVSTPGLVSPHYCPETPQPCSLLQ